VLKLSTAESLHDGGDEKIELNDFQKDVPTAAKRSG
jgi:hypothetical protein